MDNELIARVHDLPPELFNDIRREVLKPDIPVSSRKNPIITEVNAAFKFPAQLHINRYTRETFVKKYFTEAYFEIKYIDLFTKFSRCLDFASLQLIGCFSYPHETVLSDEELEKLFDICCHWKASGTGELSLFITVTNRRSFAGLEEPGRFFCMRKAEAEKDLYNGHELFKTYIRTRRLS